MSVEGKEPLELPRIGSRRWIAWMLVRLAHRIFDAEFYERITITGPDGEDLIEFIVIGDLYGGGVSSWSGGSQICDGYGVHWTDDYVPDWITEGGEG